MKEVAYLTCFSEKISTVVSIWLRRESNSQTEVQRILISSSNVCSSSKEGHLFFHVLAIL